ncbi:hypothetical protein B0H14DRAFT_2343175 [Mycena olivaceomarginata]|nr:hypothetical protein B0H14DRAFT_2343175 [Mycena olivaceomarginata]
MAAAPVAPAPAPKFSFKAPLPPSASASSSTFTSTSFNNNNPNITSGASAASQAPETATAPAAGKQRRVSLALPSSPRVVPAWHFRDDTSVPYADPDPADSASAAGRKGKVCRIALEPDDDADAGELEGGERDASPCAGAGGPGVDKGEKQEPGTGTPTGKKPRRKWTPAETQMLVDGCNIHGVGNWKAILSDPALEFQGRSPVDLKDR